MATAKKVYRSDDVAVAGVCSGIADYLDMDVAAIRILAILLFMASFGLISFVYAFLWLILPKRVAMSSETLSCAAYCDVPRDFAPLGGDGPNRHGPKLRSLGWSRACMWVGVAFLTVVCSFFLATFVSNVSWWRFMPIAVCLVGLALMMTPSRFISRLRRFSWGLTLLFAGLLLLAVSVGVVAVDTLLFASSKLWPGAMVVVGLAILGFTLEDDLFYLAAAACVAVLFLAATFGFSAPAPLEFAPVEPWGAPVVSGF